MAGIWYRIAVEDAREVDGEDLVPSLDWILANRRRWAADSGVVHRDV
jgi:hypothetical protein